MQTADDRFAIEHNWARQALDQWASFPVHQTPRPLVLIGPPAFVTGGFASGVAKLAFGSGAVVGDKTVPGDVLATLCTKRNVPSTESRLHVGKATLGEMVFATDRGGKRLPAWRLSSDDVEGHLWVLDPTIARQQWRPSDHPPSSELGPHRAQDASLVEDGTVLHYRFTEVPAHVKHFSSEHTAIIESETAVITIPVGEFVHPYGPETPIEFVGARREVSVTLKKPLGRRVLLDLDGTPVIVTGSGL